MLSVIGVEKLEVNRNKRQWTIIKIIGDGKQVCVSRVDGSRNRNLISSRVNASSPESRRGSCE